MVPRPAAGTVINDRSTRPSSSSGPTVTLEGRLVREPPVRIRRQLRGRILMKLPYDRSNRGWIKDVVGERARPEWNRDLGQWEVARSHYRLLVEAAAERWGLVRVYEEHAYLERCTGSCQSANPETVWECSCVCGGDHHGGGVHRNGWRLVGEDLRVSSERFDRVYDVVRT